MYMLPRLARASSGAARLVATPLARPLQLRAFHHLPVMPDEVLEGLRLRGEPVPFDDGTPRPVLNVARIVDATVGGGGHSSLICEVLEAARSSYELLGLDRDAEALAAASTKLAPWQQRARVMHSSYVDGPGAIDAAFGSAEANKTVVEMNGILADLGVSSHQLDAAWRGFSLRPDRDGPLDMRFDSPASALAGSLTPGTPGHGSIIEELACVAALSDSDSNSALQRLRLIIPQLRASFSGSSARFEPALAAALINALKNLRSDAPEVREAYAVLSSGDRAPILPHPPVTASASTATLTAADLVAHAPERELARIFSDFGEEKHASTVARAVVARRAERPFHRTQDLANVIADAVSFASRRAASRSRGASDSGGGHPATKCFQALRMAVNGEMDAVASLLTWGPRALAVGGRMVVITFHSLEDRLVKRAFAALCASGSATSSTGAGDAEARRRYRLVWRGGFVGPSEEETASNPRARSAKVRAIERTH